MDTGNRYIQITLSPKKTYREGALLSFKIIMKPFYNAVDKSLRICKSFVRVLQHSDPLVTSSVLHGTNNSELIISHDEIPTSINKLRRFFNRYYLNGTGDYINPGIKIYYNCWKDTFHID